MSRGRTILDERPRLDKKTGYKYVIVDGKRMAQHRYVMAQELGRPLRRDEHVHHLNADRGDNRIENLELWTRHHPSGSRVEDKVRYAHKILAKYDFEWYVRACQLCPRDEQWKGSGRRPPKPRQE